MELKADLKQGASPLQVNRASFLGLGLSTLALAACGQRGSLVPSPQTSSLALLMRKNRIRQIDYDGLSYFSDGRIVALTNGPSNLRHTAALQPACTDNGDGTSTCVNSDGSTYTIKNIASITVYGNATSTNWFTASEYDQCNMLEPYSPTIGAKNGARYYYNSPQPEHYCDSSDPVGEVFELASKLVENASQFSPTIVSAAEDVINAYEGTGLGIAAAVSFVVMLAANLPLDALLALVGLAGLTVFAFYSLIECLNGP